MSDSLPVPAKTLALEMGDRGIVIRTYEDAFRFAKTVITSGLAPKGFTTPEQVLIALQTGAEAGLTPMQSLGAVVVVNGRPSWMGDAAKALVRRAGLLKEGSDVEERLLGEGDAMVARVTAWRKGLAVPNVSEFSVTDAKVAGLWKKSGPWTQYPKRMLKYRALGFLLRDVFSDVLMGLRTADEESDMPAARGTTVALAPEPDPLLMGAGEEATGPRVVEGEVVEPEPEEMQPATGAPATDGTESPAGAPASVPWDEDGQCPMCHRLRVTIDGGGKHARGCEYEEK